MECFLIVMENFWLMPNKRIPVFRVTRPYLNLPMKPWIFPGFLEKNIILCILKGKMPFKMHKIIFFSRKKKKKKKKYVCLLYLTFSDPSPETCLFFIWPNVIPLDMIVNIYFSVSHGLKRPN